MGTAACCGQSRGAYGQGRTRVPFRCPGSPTRLAPTGMRSSHSLAAPGTATSKGGDGGSPLLGLPRLPGDDNFPATGSSWLGSRCAPAPGSRRWPRRLDGRVEEPTASPGRGGTIAGGPRARYGWAGGREGVRVGATHRGRGGCRCVRLQRPRGRRALPAATAPPSRREPPVAGARAGGQPRVRAVQDAVALLLRVHELRDILQAEPANHGCARGGAPETQRGGRG